MTREASGAGPDAGHRPQHGPAGLPAAAHGRCAPRRRVPRQGWGSAGASRFGYWSVGPTAYRRAADGALTPLAVRNPPSVWYTGGAPDVAMDNEDTQYRAITVHAPPSSTYAVSPGPWPARGSSGSSTRPRSSRSIRSRGCRSAPISRSPRRLPTRPAATALHGSDLLPNQNLGGYVSQPVNLITTLSALPALQNTGRYSGNLPVSDPISVIRVRVAGVTGPDPVSLERIREVAQQIARAHPPGRRHRGRLVADADDHRPARREVRPARADADARAGSRKASRSRS